MNTRRRETRTCSWPPLCKLAGCQIFNMQWPPSLFDLQWQSHHSGPLLRSHVPQQLQHAQQRLHECAGRLQVLWCHEHLSWYVIWKLYSRVRTILKWHLQNFWVFHPFPFVHNLHNSFTYTVHLAAKLEYCIPLERISFMDGPQGWSPLVLWDFQLESFPLISISMHCSVGSSMEARSEGLHTAHKLHHVHHREDALHQQLARRRHTQRLR